MTARFFLCDPTTSRRRNSDWRVTKSWRLPSAQRPHLLTTCARRRTLPTQTSRPDWHVHRHLGCLSEARLPPEVPVIPKRMMVVLSACVVAMLLWPSPASAQRRPVQRARVSSFVVVGGGFYRPYFYDPFFWGWYPG